MKHKGGKRGQKQGGLIQKPTSWVRTSWVLGRKTVACERFAMRSLVVKYGRLYNGHAVVDARGLFPSGWHVPSTGEWALLKDHLGGSPAVQRPPTAGSMAETARTPVVFQVCRAVFVTKVLALSLPLEKRDTGGVLRPHRVQICIDLEWSTNLITPPYHLFQMRMGSLFVASVIPSEHSERGLNS